MSQPIPRTVYAQPLQPFLGSFALVGDITIQIMPVQERLVISNPGQPDQLFQIRSNIFPDSTEYILGEAVCVFFLIIYLLSMSINTTEESIPSSKK